MPKHSWKETSLFKHIVDKNNKEAIQVITLLENPKTLSKIELVLDKGSSTPKDFTLHDSDHSFRVAQQIWELIPKKTLENLSEYELALLLLSAYLHDIGMSPSYEKVERHHAFLTKKLKNELNEKEIYEFQKWIDNQYDIPKMDIRNKIVDEEYLATRIISYYVRAKHNDWSEDWIKINLKDILLDNYNEWINDLIILCKSHHEGLHELIKDKFNPKPVSSQIVHLRYLAMCLRVADVMENDPERTPEVILKHRNISDSSLLYWLKDKQFSLIKHANRYTVFSRPTKAFLHKAIEDTASLIENELRLCEELSKLKPLSHSSFKPLDYYKWDIEPFVFKDILPKDEAYVYIQGGFRPNTAKILELLGGNQLYGNSIWAYREIIQNAFDAIKERIAYQIVHEERAPTEYLTRLGSIYSITIEITKRDDGYWLICKDQGVGMTKSIIENFFLESGSSKRHEINELERVCKTNGFNFSRTGVFGIGVLSYFMLADKVVVKTKRELNTGYHDDDSKAWYFEINGTHDFGELKRLNKTISGTEIELRLKKDFESDIEIWDNRFLSFLKGNIIILPCAVSYKSVTSGILTELLPGWSNTSTDIKNATLGRLKKAMLSKVNNDDEKILSSKQKKAIRESDTLAQIAFGEASEIIDFLFDEGEIDEIGTYRIHIPYFKLSKGHCFYYLHEEVTGEDLKILKINGGYFWEPDFGYPSYSFKGISIGIVREHEAYPPISKTKFAHIEINIETIDNASLSISRHNLSISEEVSEKIKLRINERISYILSKHLNKFDNVYGTLNTNIIPELSASSLYWHVEPDNLEATKSLCWRPIQFPLAHKDFLYQKKVDYNGKPLNLLSSLRGFDSNRWVDWADKITGPYVLTLPRLSNDLVLDFAFQILPVLLKYPPSFTRMNSDRINTIECPPSWIDVLLVVVDYYPDDAKSVYLNTAFKVIGNDIELETFNFASASKLITVSLDNLNSNSSCLFYLINAVINYNNEEQWLGLCEVKSEIIKHIFLKLKLDVFYIYTIDNGFIKITSDSLIVLNTNDTFVQENLNVDDKFLNNLV